MPNLPGPEKQSNTTETSLPSDQRNSRQTSAAGNVVQFILGMACALVVFIIAFAVCRNLQLDLIPMLLICAVTAFVPGGALQGKDGWKSFMAGTIFGVLLAVIVGVGLVLAMAAMLKNIDH